MPSLTKSHVHNPCSLPEAKIQTKKNKVKGNEPQIKTPFQPLSPESTPYTVSLMLPSLNSGQRPEERCFPKQGLRGCTAFLANATPVTKNYTLG